MVSPELEKFRTLAVDLSTRERDTQARLSNREQVLGIGRYVLLLGRPVGVFVRGSSAEVTPRHIAMPDEIVIDFVDGRHADPDARASYLLYEDRVTVNRTTLDPVTHLSVISLAQTIEGLDLVLGARDAHTPSYLVSDEELAFVDRFARDPANTLATFHFLGRPGQPVAGLEVASLGPNPL